MQIETTVNGQREEFLCQPGESLRGYNSRLPRVEMQLVSEVY